MGPGLYVCVCVCVSFFWVFNYKNYSKDWVNHPPGVQVEHDSWTKRTKSLPHLTHHSSALPWVQLLLASSHTSLMLKDRSHQWAHWAMSTRTVFLFKHWPVNQFLWLNVPPQQWIFFQRPLPLIMRKIVKCFTNYFSLSLLNKMSFSASFIAIRYDWCDANFV